MFVWLCPQAVVQVQGELQVQASQVSSLLEVADRQGLPIALMEEATKLEVWYILH